MEQQEKTSGKVLFESLREQFKRIIPQKTLRVLLSAVTIVLLVGLLIGIVSGSLAIARCGTGQRSEAGAEPVAAVQPARPDPGFSNDTVVVVHTTEPDPTEIPLPTEAPTPEPQDTPEPAVTQDPADATNYLDGKTLKKGDTDELIITVQSTLMDLGYMDPDEPTDYFGNQTQDAIITFQKHNNLLPDGIVGETTYALLVGG